MASPIPTFEQPRIKNKISNREAEMKFQSLFLLASLLFFSVTVNADPLFDAPANYPVGDAPTSVFCVDLDGDGDDDLVVVNGETDDIPVMINAGGGTFTGPVSYTVGDWPRSVYTADLDGDGDNDLAVTNGGSDNVSILMNLTPQGPDIVCGDANGDGSFNIGDTVYAINHVFKGRPASGGTVLPVTSRFKI
jgi:hypothetical protein